MHYPLEYIGEKEALRLCREAVAPMAFSRQRLRRWRDAGEVYGQLPGRRQKLGYYCKSKLLAKCARVKQTRSDGTGRKLNHPDGWSRRPNDQRQATASE
jgi:hypothetical protein